MGGPWLRDFISDVATHPLDSPELRPRLSITGMTTVFVGLALIAAELRYEVLLSRWGLWARALLFAVAVSLAVWGLKAVILRRRSGTATGDGGTRRNRFMVPREGQAYGVIMIVLFAGAMIGHSNTLLLVFALMAGPFIMNGWITFSMLRRLDVERSVPRRVMAGEPFSVVLTLINSKWLLASWLMSVCDKVDNGRETLLPEVLFTRVRKRSRDAGRYQLRLSQRGRYRFGPLQVNTRFPLGIVERGLVLEKPAEILVYPRIGRFTSTWRRRLLTATQLVSDAQPRVGTFDDDFHRIREYRPGDDPRAIHWRTTARRNELMVREFRESRDRHLILLLDLFLPENASAQQRERLEYAISLAATMCNDQMQSSRGTDIRFAANGDPFRQWNGSSDPTGREGLLDLLALLQPSSEAEMGDLLDVADRHQSPHSRTVLITSLAGREKDWNAALARDRENGDPVAVAEPPQLVIADPEELMSVFSLA